LLLVLVGALLLYNFLGAPVSAPPAETPRPQRSVTLYFAAVDGSGLVPEARQIADSPREEECLHTVITALLAGPTGQLAPILPAQTALRGVSVVGGEVRLDFSRALIDSHPGGTLGELLTVYGLTDTIAVNFPHLRQLRILVEGNAIDTLKGHVDLRQVLVPDFTLIVNPPAARPAGASPGRS
jgi:spore germination protein GerM